MLRNVMTVGGWTMASRVLGFARDILIASRLGAGPIADAFFVALKLPNLFRRLFGEGAFNSAFVPAFAGTLAAEGRAAAHALANHLAALMTLWLSLVVVVGWLLMPQVITVLAPGFVEDPLRYGLAVEMTRITFPYLLFICLAALVSGVLNGLDRFAAAAAAPVLFNLMSIGALIGLTPFVATAGHALAWGVMLSGIVQLGLVWWAARQAGMAIGLLGPIRLTPPVRAVLKKMVPGVLGAGVTQLNLAIDVIIASLLPAGAVSFLYYADRVAQLPLGVIGAAMGTALLPLLARQLRMGRPLAAHRSLNRALELSLLLTLPAAGALAMLSGPIIEGLFQRGAFDARAAAATSGALLAYAFGMPFFVLVKVFAPGFFARGDTGTPVRIGIGVVVLNLVLNLILSRWIGHVGIALSTGIAAMVNALLLAGMLMRRRHLVFDRRLRRRAWRILGAVAVMMAVLGLARWALWPVGPGWRVPVLAAICVLGAVSYAAAAQVLGALRLGEVKAMMRRGG
ncbi:putative peptidoglycan lipid II flippase [Humitalea rosea]|uniref:Probable lipid II flippase MurJ n=1 Tax=Humitalea rosea TaxID=990373 RepID=A0A2W7JDS6_9PROT|nr:murein biosynthesis integral membrane protein MurJ [Humitalea rosea]PZW50342.1 putative peptidoglycan lipid II flippase [Humitalea rosea]